MGSASQQQQSAILRARYSNSDVRGINRYRHFHSPMQLPITLFALSPINNNIDGKRSPTGSSTLPRISPTPLRRSTTTTAGRKNVIVQSSKPTQNGTITRKKPAKSTINNGKLPQLSTASTSPLNVTGIQKQLSKRQSKSSSNSDNSGIFFMQSAPINVLPSLIQSPEKLPRLSRSFSANHLQKAKLTKDLPPTTTTTTTTTSKVSKQTPITKDAATTTPLRVPRQRGVTKSSVLKKTGITIGTQTDEINYIVKSKSSSSLAAAPEPIHDTGHIQRSTQTDKVLYYNEIERKSIDFNIIHKIEERSELYEIIDNALDETIDRNSRMRTNKLIASTAQKQAEVWRDAKEFVTKVLLPSSVTLANQSRSTHSPRSPLQRIIQNWDQKF